MEGSRSSFLTSPAINVNDQVARGVIGGWLHVRVAITGDNLVWLDTYLFMQIFIIHRKRFNCISTVTSTLHAFIKYGKMVGNRLSVASP